MPIIPPPPPNFKFPQEINSSGQNQLKSEEKINVESSKKKDRAKKALFFFLSFICFAAAVVMFTLLFV